MVAHLGAKNPHQAGFCKFSASKKKSFWFCEITSKSKKKGGGGGGGGGGPQRYKMNV